MPSPFPSMAPYLLSSVGFFRRMCGLWVYPSPLPWQGRGIAIGQCYAQERAMM